MDARFGRDALGLLALCAIVGAGVVISQQQHELDEIRTALSRQGTEMRYLDARISDAEPKIAELRRRAEQAPYAANRDCYDIPSGRPCDEAELRTAIAVRRQQLRSELQAIQAARDAARR